MAEEPEIGGREPTMLAGVRHIAYGLATVMAGFLVVALANSIWAALFRADALVLFGIEKPLCMFDCGSLWWVSVYAFWPHGGLCQRGCGDLADRISDPTDRKINVTWPSRVTIRLLPARRSPVG
jgi:hypothetical protein